MKREEELTVSVKPLEWVRAQFNREHAETVLGWYSVEYRQDPRRDRDWYWSARGKFYGPLHSEEAVKAAAQADYEARIRSALLCTPKPEAEPVAWRWVWKTTGSPLEQRFADHDLYSWTYRETPPSGEAAKKMVIEPLYANPPKPDEETLEPDAWMDEFGEVSTVKPAINPRPLYSHPPKPETTEGGAHEKGWQPIETAPKGHRQDILIFDRGVVRIAWWGAAAYNRKTKEYDLGWTNGGTYGFQPSHWMPLPSAPAALTAKPDTDGRGE